MRPSSLRYKKLVIVLSILLLAGIACNQTTRVSPTEIPAPTSIATQKLTSPPLVKPTRSPDPTLLPPTAALLTPTETPAVTPTTEPTEPPSLEPPDEPGEIAFSSGGDLYLVDPDGTNLAQITNAAGSELQPDWSPDGKSILYTASGSGDVTNIYLLDLATLTSTQLTDSGKDRYARWSPTGEEIVFYSQRMEGFGIYLMHPDGTSERCTYQTNDYIADLVWGTDMKYVYFYSYGDAGYVYKLDLFTSVARRFLEDETLVSGFDWSPTGQYMAFQSARSGRFQIYLVDTSGENVTQVSYMETDAQQPSFNPSGSKLVFSLMKGRSHTLYLLDLMNAKSTQLLDMEAIDPDWLAPALYVN
jgi:Tol biopolymer transport system component